jgi:hypothetical protein
VLGKKQRCDKLGAFNLNTVRVNLSVRQEEQVVIASLRKHCSNLEHELLQHAIGNDCMTQAEVTDNITFIDSAMLVMKHYGD